MTTESSPSSRMLSPAYEERLLQDYSASTVDTLVHDWRHAPLPDQPGETLPYVRLNQDNGTKPILYVPGFTEGIAAKAPFAAELAELGYDVILPDQNRKKILEDGVTGRKSATYSQAVNYMAVLAAEGVTEVDVLTHSYGSLIFDRMTRIATQLGLEYFQEAKTIMLTPAGFSKESLLKIVTRLAVSVHSEGKGNPKEFDEPDMLKAGIINMLANIPRTLREGVELSRLQVEYRKLLLGRVGTLCLMNYAADELYPEKVLQDEFAKAVTLGATWAVPIAQKERFDPQSAKPHATHNDEQFNPYRVAGAVHQLLQAA